MTFKLRKAQAIQKSRILLEGSLWFPFMDFFNANGSQMADAGKFQKYSHRSDSLQPLKSENYVQDIYKSFA